jgi:DNA repair protein RecN (Recombination protein N)
VTPVLAELRISGLGVIDDARIEPAPALTVVTGETGAGKTMIVTALGLICGGRAESDRVRTGARRAVVEARFEPGENESPRASGTRTFLADFAQSVGGDIDDDGSLVAVRSVSADGRSRAHVGGRAAPVSTLAELTEPLVTVHGQAEAMTLLRPASQRAVLDSYAHVQQELDDYRALRAEWLAVQDDIDDRAGRARERAQREHVLRLALSEIDQAAPQPGEDVELAAEVRRLDDADALRDAAQSALSALAGADDLAGDPAADHPSAITLLASAMRLLESSSDPELRARLDDLRSASAVLADVAGDLTSYLGALDADPERLARALERQSVLRSLVRRYGEDVDAVLAWADQARTELTELDTSDEALESLRRRAAELAAQVRQAAAALTERRAAAADALGTAATGELTHLAMGTARLRIAVTPRAADAGSRDMVVIDGKQVAAGPDGTDQVEILLTPRPGAPELPVARAASGGELSRVMLALEVVLAGADPVATLIFDEVDAGVGGRAATEIGRRLALLSRDHQVIVVTHLAQVAAFADRHFVVDADADGTVGASAVRRVDGDERMAELARMLGGTDGAAARAHAADLLAVAGRRPATGRRPVAGRANARPRRSRS